MDASTKYAIDQCQSRISGMRQDISILRGAVTALTDKRDRAVEAKRKTVQSEQSFADDVSNERRRASHIALISNRPSTSHAELVSDILYHTRYMFAAGAFGSAIAAIDRLVASLEDEIACKQQLINANQDMIGYLQNRINYLRWSA